MRAELESDGNQTDQFDLPRLCRYFSEKSPLPMLAVEGPTHIVRYLNPAFAKLAGKPEAELLGRIFGEAGPESEGNECLTMLNEVFRTGSLCHLEEQVHDRLTGAFWSYDMWAILGADETTVGVMIQVTDSTEAVLFRRRARDMNEALVVSSVRQHELIDAIERGEKERHKLEAEIFQAQKLESLGVMAGGIAHDLNNMLTPVLGFAELAIEKLPAASPVSPYLDEVRKNARRAADLVRQMLAFAGKGRFVVQLVDLSSLIRDMSGLLGSSVSNRTQMIYELAPNLPLVEADATQLCQVVLNLVTNATEAVGESGVVTVRTGLVARDLGSEQERSPSVYLEVSDTGSGIPPEMVDKIFDPFFTTKFTGRGLGLAVVQGIARGHQGTVRVKSKPGMGSAFRLELPCTTKSAEPPKETFQTSKGWHGTGTVLVIDDDDNVRALTSQILEQAGLTVFHASGGREGLDVFRTHSHGIDAVVLDLTMPIMGGLEVAAVMHRIRPDIRIILMSGYSAVDVTRQTAGRDIAGFVQKPFNRADLLTAVRHALEQ